MNVDPEFVEMLAQLLAKGQRRDTMPESPFAYPRRALIEDDVALQRLAELNQYMEDLRRLERKGRALIAKATAAREELFDRLEDAYPGVHPRLASGRGGSGYRQHGEQWYFVGWDQEPKAEGGDEPYQGGRGQYL